MKKILTTSLVASIALSASLFAADTTKEAVSVQEMFSNGTTSGQIRFGYFDVDTRVIGENDTSVGAIGGQLKFETASFYGVSVGAAMYTSQAITAISGNQDLNIPRNHKFNDDLTSSEKHYTELAEAYINYTYKGFNFRGGRQLIDTPLADSDDIRMTPHTFEAYVLSYTLEDLGLTFTGANVQRWQGVDAGYANVTDNRWAETNGAGGSGTWMAATTYANDFLEVGTWYYDIDKAADAVYVDATGTIAISDDVEITIAGQYLDESESTNNTGVRSGIDGSIAGAMVEGSIFGLTAMVAYDTVSVKNGREIFEGFGGGSSYTNMDTMTAGTLHDGTVGDGDSYVVGLGYEIAGANIFAAYGDFKADALLGGTKAHVTEIDLGVEYEYNEGEFDVALYYIIGEDKESFSKTEFDDSHIQLTLNYNF